VALNRKTQGFIRKSHRYLGLFLGLQFIFWTVSGLYFSWTDIDTIHGDAYRIQPPNTLFDNLLVSDSVFSQLTISKIALRDLNGIPHFWINGSNLYDAQSGEKRQGISEDEALFVAGQNMIPELVPSSVELIVSTAAHHEYRGRPLPAYAINYTHKEAITAYVSYADGAFQTVRHRDWRWFDFLWMTHTMDYQSRDNFNTTLLRVFSLLGLITVLSGFVLFVVSSPTIRKTSKKWL
jgi:hypothetical protein|tara:strand:- start:1693 stop:2400 length:708 start_codon:yes stop_codon:yes gene_type:complete